MSVPFLVLLAIAIPAVIAGALLPPLLLHDQMQTASATFPERLRESLGVDREYKFSVWELAIFILLSLSAFTPTHIQEIIAICSSILLAVWAASRSWVYLKARYQFSAELSGDSRRILLIFGLGAVVFSLVFVMLSASLALT